MEQFESESLLNFVKELPNYDTYILSNQINGKITLVSQNVKVKNIMKKDYK